MYPFLTRCTLQKASQLGRLCLSPMYIYFYGSLWAPTIRTFDFTKVALPDIDTSFAIKALVVS